MKLIDNANNAIQVTVIENINLDTILGINQSLVILDTGVS